MHGRNTTLPATTTAAAEGQLNGIAERAVLWQHDGRRQANRDEDDDGMEEKRKKRGKTAAAFPFGE
jgi:hypothetical protein